VAIQSAKRMRVPCIVDIVDLWPESIVSYMKVSKLNPIILFLYRLEKWIYRKADHLIFSMEGGAEYIHDKKWANVINMKRVSHINNGVDINEFDRHARETTTIDCDLDNKSTFKVVYAGSIGTSNNVGLLISIAKVTLSDCKVKYLIWGDGDELEQLKSIVAKENLTNVVFKGRVGRKFIPGILCKSDLTFISFNKSLISKYGVSLNKLFEYFASGKPVLMDTKVGYDLITKYSAGIVTGSQSPEDMAADLLSIANMGIKQRNTMGKNSRLAAQEHDYSILSERLYQIITVTINQ